MATLAEELAFTTVRLEGVTPTGVSVGTGFLFFKDQRLFVVTNKHVVGEVIQGKFELLLQKAGANEPEYGSSVEVKFSKNNFVGHPDLDVDVAVMNLSDVISRFEKEGAPAYFRYLCVDNYPSDAELEKFIGPMEEIIFIGYPSGIWDSVNKTPVARRGMTATPCYVDFEGTKTFLIDASVFPGSSGSPVFIYYAGSHPDKEGNLYAGNRVHFLGLISSVYHRNEEGDIKVVAVPTAQRAYAEIKQMIDIGVVFKWYTITEAIDFYLSVVSRSLTNRVSDYSPGWNRW
ncbi:trypsin-like serine peptidase [Pseudomonas juntendi]|uniref:trypsin-like serine peptidase n=1 Tax=Pseudomonas juntendi TaxID=2666183 RepID=UPI001F3B6107|nr:serine protease [Pseudomonas juntendi]MCO7058334.1 serine protease [Pseudomonas juntendi]UJM10722.1 serine protease [Pseudomonas juntendi]UXA40690.1 serine protease [Pseudomonas juntendi]